MRDKRFKGKSMTEMFYVLMPLHFEPKVGYRLIVSIDYFAISESKL